jgi:AraC-like DNA-binding protein
LSTHSHRFPARYFALLVDYLESTGVDRATLLRAAGIRSLGAAQAHLTQPQIEKLLTAAERMSGRQDLGFEMGSRIKLTSHDILGYAFLTSPTLGDLFRLIANYHRLITPAFAVRVARRAGKAELIYQPVVPMSHRTMRAYQEAIAVSDHHQIRSLLPAPMLPYDIHLSIEPPPHVARYRGLVPARVHFGDPAPGVRLTFDAALLGSPLAMANSSAMRAAEERCKTLLHGADGHHRWSDWCAMMLREAEDCQPTLEQLAGFMNLSSRTLSRCLDRENNGFRALSLRIRTERACRMLTDDTMSVSQIAYRLGYSDVPGFIRAFRKETGTSPTAYRTQKLRRPAARDHC